MEGISSTSSSVNFPPTAEDHPLVDDFYFYDDKIFPISDEKYAEELQLQEALYSSQGQVLGLKTKLFKWM